MLIKIKHVLYLTFHFSKIQVWKEGGGRVVSPLILEEELKKLKGKIKLSIDLKRKNNCKMRGEKKCLLNFFKR
jgi:hypothetical protein